MLLNYGLFQLGWFACVMGAAKGHPWLGLPVVAMAVLVHLFAARQPVREASLLLICTLLGAVLDSALLLTGWIEYPNGLWLPGLAPYWIVAMWVLFGTTLNRSLRWMRGRPWLALLFGAVGGPLSYAAGEGMGAMSMSNPVMAMTALAALWGLVLPLLFATAARLDGFSEPRRPGFVHTSWRERGISGHA
jgi:hypothetical protein